MQTLDLDHEPQLHLWTRDEYYQMAAVGFFQDKRVQLIGGQVIEISPMKSPHATGVDLVVEILRQRLGSGVYVREQKPLVLSEISEPEPDVAVVEGTIRDYAQQHPTTALLIVEVSDSTLQFDRLTKGSLYACSNLQEYWILNLVDSCLEVYRAPAKDSQALYGYQYAETQIFQPVDTVSLLVFPEIQITVAELLP